MKCSTCGKPLNSSDRRRRYCSAKCRDNKGKHRHLRAVEPDEPPSALEPRTLAVDEAARDGSDLELLMAMRDRVAETVADPNCPPRDLAALTRRLEELRKQIAAERLRLKEELADAEAVDDETWDEASI
ncbi:hypothetical protein EG850_11020 [Gulosibacter macacae]|uniref:Uncharacterized protein n=1 Tax=Gulosibacter macacae TaxID=2488791 RepID=A0A3P3VZ09_9MICO|nr:hypothetical protein [Gulosibacter macacae]RRJ85913.1 hypothetical protein EG850_11020 [Gulosibacter macacae]